MAKNPMQRKAQNSFLLGILITLLITGIIIAILVIQLTKITKEQKEAKKNLKNVYIVSQDINSGESITIDKLTSKVMDSTAIPSNALTMENLESKINVLDQEGNLIKKVDVVSKINLKSGTVITSDMIAETSEIAGDLRKQQYNMIIPTSQLTTGKYIDVRLRLPNGTDFIVVSHKKVEIPTINGVDSINTILLNLQETEILTLSCAIVESYKIKGALLYASEYIEPGLQGAAKTTYIPDDATIELIRRDPNCVEEAKTAMEQRIANTKNTIRNPINNGLNQNGDSAFDNAVSGLEAELQKAQEERQKYLESLGGSY